MKKFRITFNRRVKEFCSGDFLAKDLADATRMYDNGEINTEVVDSDLLDETDVEIIEVTE